MGEPGFHLIAADTGHPGRVVARGDIDLATVDDFAAILERACCEADEVAVDLSEVTFCDSTGLRALFIAAADTKLTVIIRQPGPLCTLLRISGLDRVVTVTPID